MYRTASDGPDLYVLCFSVTSFIACRPSCNVFYTLEVSYTLNVTPEQQKLADGLQGEFCTFM